MIKQMRNLTKLQLTNLYGINVLRHTKDKREKRKKQGLAVAYLMLLVIACAYIGMMTYGYVLIGLDKLVPAYLIMLSSLIILFLSIFKADSVIFQKNAYDILVSLPIRHTAIVVSRFLRMYVENFILTFAIMVPGIVVYGVMVRPGISFYLIGFIVTIFIPFIPITIATFFGALITAIASRMKHKSMVTVGLSVMLIIGFMIVTSRLSAMEDEFSMEMLQNLSEIAFSVIENIYPPAIWLGSAMISRNFMSGIACVAGGLLLFAIVIAIVAVNYQWICRGLYSTNAKHDYQMERLKKDSVLGAMYRRELRHYLSSSVYVTNTIIGPILAVVLCVTVLVMGLEQMQTLLNAPINVKGAIPFVLAGVFCVMPTTCTSISLEGKEWWIIKSLPIKTKDWLDGKLLLFASLVLPFFLVSEVLLAIALKPGLVEMIWLFVIPVVMICFAGVFGITVNLKMPVFSWENEVTIVKQSASALIGGLGGFLIVLLCMVPVLLIPTEYENPVKGMICLIVGCVTVILYRKNNKVDLQML